MAATLQLREGVRGLPQDIFSPERFMALSGMVMVVGFPPHAVGWACGVPAACCLAQRDGPGADIRSLEEQADTVKKAGQAINELFNGASTLLRRHEALKADLERLMHQEQRAAAAVQKRIEVSDRGHALSDARTSAPAMWVGCLPGLQAHGSSSQRHTQGAQTAPQQFAGAG
jgi:hypothetical protein